MILIISVSFLFRGISSESELLFKKQILHMAIFCFYQSLASIENCTSIYHNFHQLPKYASVFPTIKNLSFPDW